jgi:hypothetical protein
MLHCMSPVMAYPSRVRSLIGVRLGARRVVAAAEDELRSHLDSGEKLLWAGRPAQGIVLTQQDWFLIPFSAVWLGIAVYSFWPKSTKTPEPLALFVAAGLLFIGIGIYALIGRFIADLSYRSRLIYGVTDRRAIILSGMRRRSVQSIYLSSLSTLKLEERRDRSGTIYFGDQPSSSYWHGSNYGQGVGTQFFRIADAKQVYTILHEAMQRQKK